MKTVESLGEGETELILPEFTSNDIDDHEESEAEKGEQTELETTSIETNETKADCGSSGTCENEEMEEVD